MKDNIEEVESRIKEQLSKLGIESKDAESIIERLRETVILVSMVDTGLQGINFSKLRTLNGHALAATLDKDRHDRLEMICEFAEKYQARFGTEKAGAAPDINVFGMKSVPAA